MSEITLKELDPRLQKQVQGADQSIARGNPNYAIDICSGILKQHPGCLDVRKILRKAQRKLAASKGKGSSVFSKVTNASLLLRGSQVKKDPLAAMDTCEKMLKVNPSNIPVLRMLGQAAQEAGFIKTAIFCFENIHEIDSKNIDNLLMLGEAHLANGNPKEAVKVGDAILEFSPGHGDASDMIRRASVTQSIEQGKWDEENTDFREKLRDEDQAVKLEQQSRNVNDEATLHELIGEVYAKIQAEPENINHYKKIADYYHKLKDYNTAIEWVAYARSLPTGAADVTLESYQSDLYVEQIEGVIAAKEAELAEDPENAALQEELENYKTQFAQYRLEEAQTRVEKYPNDYNYRFDLGKLYFETGNVDGAIQQFQLSQRNPKVRTRSLLYMGRAFKQSKKYDLATEQLLTLKKELQLMDELKKSAIYELAEAYEMMGREDDAVEEYKILYQNDIGYRDVAQKINAFYDKKNS